MGVCCIPGNTFRQHLNVHCVSWYGIAAVAAAVAAAVNACCQPLYSTCSCHGISQPPTIHHSSLYMLMSMMVHMQLLLHAAHQ
jgi:hypothetical protein